MTRTRGISLFVFAILARGLGGCCCFPPLPGSDLPPKAAVVPETATEAQYDALLRGTTIDVHAAWSTSLGPLAIAADPQGGPALVAHLPGLPNLRTTDAFVPRPVALWVLRVVDTEGASTSVDADGAKAPPGVWTDADDEEGPPVVMGALDWTYRGPSGGPLYATRTIVPRATRGELVRIDGRVELRLPTECHATRVAIDGRSRSVGALRVAVRRKDSRTILVRLEGARDGYAGHVARDPHGVALDPSSSFDVGPSEGANATASLERSYATDVASFEVWTCEGRYERSYPFSLVEAASAEARVP